MNITSFISALYEERIPAQIIDEADENTTYVGYCLPTCTGVDDARWFIKRIKKVGTTQRIEYPNGERKYNQKWTERTSLNYKYTPAWK